MIKHIKNIRRTIKTSGIMLDFNVYCKIANVQTFELNDIINGIADLEDMSFVYTNNTIMIDLEY